MKLKSPEIEKSEIRDNDEITKVLQTTRSRVEMEEKTSAPDCKRHIQQS